MTRRVRKRNELEWLKRYRRQCGRRHGVDRARCIECLVWFRGQSQKSTCVYCHPNLLAIRTGQCLEPLIEPFDWHDPWVQIR